MLRLGILELLEERGKTKYWLAQQVSMSYQNFDKMVSNATQSIRYDVIEEMCDALNCSIQDLFVKVDD